ncbi:hypothetical protein FRB95_000179 [Tulasnella sp. JGI-2019a]|nr:hypothetical protein FRB95_000179 [Tulasnella sp. JGI-2019a]
MPAASTSPVTIRTHPATAATPEKKGNSDNAIADSVNIQNAGPVNLNSTVSGAVGRSATRALALYFARPVRLFRPSKITGWMTLRSAAASQNTALSPQYLSLLIKTEGWKIIPRHFVPPLLINSVLGVVLFESFTISHEVLKEMYPNTSSILLASTSGAITGCAHAIAGAPAENVRLILEGHKPSLLVPNNAAGMSQHAGWRSAWMEVFRQGVEHVDVPTKPAPVTTPVAVPKMSAKTRREYREFRGWMKDVKSMARGWDGMGWGCAKDGVGFAVFFTIFETTRQTASTAVRYLDYPNPATIKPVTTNPKFQDDDFEKVDTSIVPSLPQKARLAHGTILVSGGVLAGLGFEYSARPFDNARRIARTSAFSNTWSGRAFAVVEYVKQHGVRDALFRSPVGPPSSSAEPVVGTAAWQRRALMALGVLGRLGPWGVGFLLWEGLAVREDGGE